MPCLLILLFLFGPRLICVLIAIFTNWFSIAWDNFFLAFLGFVFMPFTTLAYTFAMINGGVYDIWIVVICITVFLDFKQITVSKGN